MAAIPDQQAAPTIINGRLILIPGRAAGTDINMHDRAGGSDRSVLDRSLPARHARPRHARGGPVPHAPLLVRPERLVRRSKIVMPSGRLTSGLVIGDIR
jgi:hypothetical protein